MKRTRRKPGQLRLRLSPQHGGAFTRWHLTGSTVTPIPMRELRLLFRKLSFWSGWPIELVLPADVATVAWFDSWTAAVDPLPEHLLHVRFELERAPALPCKRPQTLVTRG